MPAPFSLLPTLDYPFMRVLRPLGHRPLALLWTGQVLAALGHEVYRVALMWLAVGLVGANAGYLSALESGAMLAVGLFGGIWADQWDARRTMIWVDLVRAILVGLIPVIATFHPITVPILIPIVVLVSGMTALFDPALQSVVPRLAPNRSLVEATNAILEATRRAARIGGPAIVGFLSASVATIHLFAIDAIGFACSAISLFALHRSLPFLPGVAGPKTAKAVWNGLASSISLVREIPVLRFALITTGANWSLWGLTYTLGLPMLVRSRPDASPALYGWVVMAYGVGNLASNLVVGSFPIHRPGRLMYLGILVLGLGFAGLAVSSTIPAILFCAAFAAIGGPMDDLSFLSLVQNTFDPREIARVYRLRLTVAYGSLTGCFLLAPFLFRTWSPSTIIFASALGTLALGFVGLTRFARE